MFRNHHKDMLISQQTWSIYLELAYHIIIQTMIKQSDILSLKNHI